MVRGEGGTPKGDTRARLVAAARAHLDRRGLEGLTLRGIARDAGVSHGAPSRHFAGLGSLLAAVAAFGFRELHASVAAAVDEAGPDADPVAQLAAAGRGYVDFACANRGAFELMFRNEHLAEADPDLLDAAAAAFLQLVDIVERAQAAGWHPDRTSGELAALVWASVHGLVSLWLPGTLAGAMSLTGTTAQLHDLVDLNAELLIGQTHRTPT